MRVTALAEATTGLALLIDPSLVAQLLLGSDLTGVAVPVARVTGIALLGLAVACWARTPLLGMLAYSGLVTVFFGYLGIRGEWVGPMLWPAFVLHAGITGWCLWCVRGMDSQRR